MSSRPLQNVTAKVPRRLSWRIPVYRKQELFMKERNLQVIPNQKSVEVGSCSACLNVCDQYGNVYKRKVWLVWLDGVKFCLCKECMDDFVRQVLAHQKQG